MDDRPIGPAQKQIEMTMRHRAPWVEAARIFGRDKAGMLGMSLLLMLVFASVAAPVLAPYDPIQTNMAGTLLPPSRHHLMGTDQLGRDILSRVLYGGRLSLPVGVIAVCVGVLGGVLLGLPAGYYGGWIDTGSMRAVDVMLAMPSILLALLVMAITGPGLYNVMLAIGASQIPSYARVIRGCVLSARENVYVEAARAMGASSARLMVRHLLPNVIAPVIVLATLGVSTSILWAAAFSFLGLGAQPPSIEWGDMINLGRNYLSIGWWITFFPGMAMVLAVLALNLAGDALREAFDPRLKSI